MNKSDLVAAMAAKTGDTKKSAEEALNAFVDVVTAALVKGEKGTHKDLLKTCEEYKNLYEKEMSE